MKHLVPYKYLVHSYSTLVVYFGRAVLGARAGRKKGARKIQTIKNIHYLPRQVVSCNAHLTTDHDLYFYTY